MDVEALTSRARVNLEEGQLVALNRGLFRVTQVMPISRVASLDMVIETNWPWFAPAFRSPNGHWYTKPHPERPMVIMPYSNAADCVKSIALVTQRFDDLEGDLANRARAIKRERVQELCQLGKLGKL